MSSSQLMGKFLVGIACLAVMHSAFSTYEYLSILKALNGGTTKLPTSVIVEALIGLALFLPGTALASADLKDVTYRGELAKRTLDESDARMSFMSLSTRGRALFGEDVDKAR